MIRVRATWHVPWVHWEDFAGCSADSDFCCALSWRLKGSTSCRLVADLRGNLVGDHGERELARAVAALALALTAHHSSCELQGTSCRGLVQA